MTTDIRAALDAAEQHATAAAVEDGDDWAHHVLAAVRHLYGDQKAADMGARDDLRTARAVLTRWGHPAPQPQEEVER